MRFLARLALLSVVLLVACIGVLQAEESKTPKTLTGAFVADDESGPLEAVFTSSDDDTWQVDFRFTFQEQPLTFSGSAEGSLSDGLLEGTVYNERGNRTFTFKGLFENGSFSGTHAEIEDGIEFPTGTLTLDGHQN